MGIVSKNIDIDCLNPMFDYIKDLDKDKIVVSVETEYTVSRGREIEFTISDGISKRFFRSATRIEADSNITSPQVIYEHFTDILESATNPVEVSEFQKDMILKVFEVAVDTLASEYSLMHNKVTGKYYISDSIKVDENTEIVQENVVPFDYMEKYNNLVESIDICLYKEPLLIEDEADIVNHMVDCATSESTIENIHFSDDGTRIVVDMEVPDDSFAVPAEYDGLDLDDNEIGSPALALFALFDAVVAVTDLDNKDKRLVLRWIALSDQFAEESLEALPQMGEPEVPEVHPAPKFYEPTESQQFGLFGNKHISVDDDDKIDGFLQGD